jgi:hypothetical protein
LDATLPPPLSEQHGSSGVPTSMPPPARPPAPRAAITQPPVGISTGNLMPHIPAQPYTNASVFGDERQKSTTPKSGGGGKQKKKKINKNEISMPTDFQFCSKTVCSKFTIFSQTSRSPWLGSGNWHKYEWTGNGRSDYQTTIAGTRHGRNRTWGAFLVSRICGIVMNSFVEFFSQIYSQVRIFAFCRKFHQKCAKRLNVSPTSTADWIN